jgi:D-lactate dehydrogenase
LNKAGYKVLIPQGFDKLCCGLPWRSKGQAEQAQNTTNTFVDSLYRASANGRYTVVTDASPCALSLKNQQKITVIDVVDFIASECLTKLNVSQTSAPVMLHVTCSSRRNQLAEQQTGVGIIAEKCSSQIIEPDDIHCCGFAGDKGFTTPQLNASALATLQQQVPKQCRQGVSNSRTCEIGLTSYSGVPYQSVLYLLDKLSSAKR